MKKARVISRVLACCVLAFLANSPAFADDKQGIQATSETETASASRSHVDKVLVTFNRLPDSGDYEIIGPISVFKRWFGGTGAAMQLLGQKARELGANAVVESAVWLAPAFPAQVAPHGSGIAVRINDPAILAALADEASTWE